MVRRILDVIKKWQLMFAAVPAVFIFVLLKDGRPVDWSALLLTMALVSAAVLVVELLDDLVRRQAQRQLEAIRQGKLPTPSLEDAKNGEIEVTADGFLLSRNGKVLRRVSWSHLTKITAYKRDLLTTDLICWAFDVGEDGLPVEVHEEIKGFDNLKQWVEEHFDGYVSDWFSRVAFPAFATNPTVIWSASGSSGGGREQS